jgi:hypothetical protein
VGARQHELNRPARTGIDVERRTQPFELGDCGQVGVVDDDDDRAPELACAVDQAAERGLFLFACGFAERMSGRFEQSVEGEDGLCVGGRDQHDHVRFVEARQRGAHQAAVRPPAGAGDDDQCFAAVKRLLELEQRPVDVVLGLQRQRFFFEFVL